MKVWSSKMIMVFAAAMLILAGCGNNNTSSSSNAGSKLQVVTTFYPMYEFTKQVAGEHADVVMLIPGGVEPHDWEPSAKDMAAIKDADIFVYNGIVEEWVESALSSAVNDKRIDVEASHSIDLMEGEAHSHGTAEDEEDHDHDHDAAAEGEEHAHEDGTVHAEEEEEEGHSHEEEHEHTLDPHVWLSPVLAQEEVKAIQAALVKADPEHEADYNANAEAYIAKLKELDAAYTAGLKGAKRTEFVTQHTAFGYLAQQYGLTQVPISGLSPDQEPSPEQMAKVIELAKEHDIRTIFFETLVDPKIAQTIADEIGAQTAVLNPLEGLTPEEVDNGLDYIAVMNNNLAALTKALNE